MKVSTFESSNTCVVRFKTDNAGFALIIHDEDSIETVARKLSKLSELMLDVNKNGSVKATTDRTEEYMKEFELTLNDKKYFVNKYTNMIKK